MLQHFVGRDQIRVRPRIERLHPEHDRKEQDRHQRQRPARRLEDPPEDAPGSAREVLDHHERHRSERDPEEQQIRDEPDAEEVIAVEHKPDRAADEADSAGDQGARAVGVEIRGRRVVVVSAINVPPASRAQPAARPQLVRRRRSARRSAGTSSTVAC